MAPSEGRVCTEPPRPSQQPRSALPLPEAPLFPRSTRAMLSSPIEPSALQHNTALPCLHLSTTGVTDIKEQNLHLWTEEWQTAPSSRSGWCAVCPSRALFQTGKCVYVDGGFIAPPLFSMGAIHFLLEFLCHKEHDWTSNEACLVSLPSVKLMISSRRTYGPQSPPLICVLNMRLLHPTCTI